MAKNFWAHRPVLVTGANGFLGAELCRALAENGALVTGMVHDTSRPFNPALPIKAKNFNYMRGTVTDLDSVKGALRISNAKTIFHLAADPNPKSCQEKPLEAHKTNVIGTMNVLEASRLAKERPEVVFSSSYYAYAKKRGKFLEEDALGQETVYGTTKAIAEQIARSYSKSFNVRIAIARFGTIFGPSVERSETLVPKAIRAILAGTKIELNRQAKKRDYVFLGDAVSALLLLGEKCREKKVCDNAFNFSNGKPLTPKQVVEKIAAIEGRQPQTGIRNGASEYDMASDSSKAVKILGWKPTRLESALKETIVWHKKMLSAQGKRPRI